MPIISANQFGTFLLTDPSVRLRKLKELSDPKNMGYYTPFRQKLRKAIKDRGALTKSCCDEMITYSRGTHQKLASNYQICGKGLKKLLESSPDRLFRHQPNDEQTLKSTPLVLDEQHPVLIRFGIDLVMVPRLGSEDRPMAVHLHFPFDKTPTGRPKKVDADRVDLFLLAYQEALDGAKLPLDAAILHVATGQVLTVADVTDEIRQIYPIERQSVTEYLRRVP